MIILILKNLINFKTFSNSILSLSISVYDEIFDYFNYEIIMYTYVCFILEQKKKRNIIYIAVIAGSEGVPDALQKCHSLSRDLQNNQTTIFMHLSDLKLQINNFTTQVNL